MRTSPSGHTEFPFKIKEDADSANLQQGRIQEPPTSLKILAHHESTRVSQAKGVFLACRNF